jgi:hypothetical protein
MADKTFREHYFQALGIAIYDECKLESALKLAHDIRRFEIELYWKRATYFWAFQLIAFTALGFLLKDGHITPLGQLPFGRLLIPAPIGVITALAGYLSARGAKFWQENWEAHVDLLEDATKQRLTHVILCRQAPQFSVSRVNQKFFCYLILGWAAVLIVGTFPSLAGYLKEHSASLGYIAFAITVLLAVGLSVTVSDFTGCAYHTGDDSWTDYPPTRPALWQRLLRLFSRPKPPFIIWRDRSAKDATEEQTPTPAPSEPTTDSEEKPTAI